jgi:hypothetical protein
MKNVSLVVIISAALLAGCSGSGMSGGSGTSGSSGGALA